MMLLWLEVVGLRAEVERLRKEPQRCETSGQEGFARKLLDAVLPEPTPDGPVSDLTWMQAIDEAARLRRDRDWLREIERCRMIITDLCGLHCTGGAADFDSERLGPNNDAIRYLAEIGRVEIVSETGRRVVARWRS